MGGSEAAGPCWSERSGILALSGDAGPREQVVGCSCCRRGSPIEPCWTSVIGGQESFSGSLVKANGYSILLVKTGAGRLSGGDGAREGGREAGESGLKLRQ